MDQEFFQEREKGTISFCKLCFVMSLFMIARDQESITNHLRALDFEEGCCRSQEMLQTIQKQKFQSQKSHSFRQISDWSNRYRLEDSHSLPSNPKIKNIEQQYYSFSMSLPRQYSLRESSPTKQKLELMAVNVKFAHSRSKAKLKEKGGNWNPEKANMSFYDAHYEPLALLYRKKTQNNLQRTHHREGLPLILPRKTEDPKHPKTQRTSSILRMMKKHQQIQQLRKKSEDMQAYKFPN